MERDLCAKTFAGQYASKRRGEIEECGLFVRCCLLLGTLPESRLNGITPNNATSPAAKRRLFSIALQVLPYKGVGQIVIVICLVS